MTLYEDNFLIDRFYSELSKIKASVSKSKLSIQKPEVSIANKKTYIRNYKTICAKLNRDENDVKKFFEAELMTSTSIDLGGGLKIQGIFRIGGIQKIITNYIKEYVLCKECNSCNTLIEKENRILFIKCNDCLSKKAI